MRNGEENALLAALWDMVDVSVMVLGRKDGRFVFINQQVERMIDIQGGKIIGMHYRDVFIPDFQACYEKLLSACQDGEVHQAVYFWTERSIWEQVSAKCIHHEALGHLLILTISNITEVCQAEYEYKQLAYFDPILRLPNGYALEKDINHLDNPEKAVMIYFRIERFDDICELFGMEVGDALLMAIRDWVVGSEMRGTKMYWIGKGFVLMKDDISIEGAIDRAQEIIRRFDRAWVFALDGKDYEIYRTVKLGIVYGKYIKNEMREILMRTIRTPTGKEGYVLYSEDIDKKARDDLRLRQQFIDCVQRDMEGFEVHYHPIVEAGSHRWIGAEALCRWTTPEGERIPPVYFIQLAEQLGMVSKIDRWVCETAMSHCMDCGLDKKDFFLDVNFSPMQDVNAFYIDSLMEVLRKTGYPPLKLNVEITESAKMKFTTENLRGLRYLTSKGIMLSIDDFGTGYSSFENLIRIPATVLKTEKLFIDDIHNDRYRQYLIKLMIDVAHHLGMALVAEGVETQSQMGLLESLGVDRIQGYFFSRPLSGEQLMAQAHQYTSDRLMATDK